MKSKEIKKCDCENCRANKHPYKYSEFRGNCYWNKPKLLKKCPICKNTKKKCKCTLFGKKIKWGKKESE